MDLKFRGQYLCVTGCKTMQYQVSSAVAIEPSMESIFCNNVPIHALSV